MLNIFNNLKPFIEDCYTELGVREYSRIMKIAPPTASKILKNLSKEKLLIKTKQKIYLVFRANRENYLFKDLAVAYWRKKLSDLFKEIHNEVLFKQIILFGSLAKAENTFKSDVDIYVDLPRKKIDVSSIEKKLKRSVQIHFKEESKNNLLLKNIKEGIIII